MVMQWGENVVIIIMLVGWEYGLDVLFPLIQSYQYLIPKRQLTREICVLSFFCEDRMYPNRTEVGTSRRMSTVLIMNRKDDCCCWLSCSSSRPTNQALYHSDRWDVPDLTRHCIPPHYECVLQAKPSALGNSRRTSCRPLSTG